MPLMLAGIDHPQAYGLEAISRIIGACQGFCHLRHCLS